MKFVVQKNEEGIRIDKYISTKDERISRSNIQRRIEEGGVLVNNSPVKVSYKVMDKDIIVMEEEKPKEVEIKAEDIPLDIVFEDDDIIVVNKQKGLVVHPGNGNPDGTLVNAIMAHCKGSLSGVGGKIRPGIVHRIDKDTSGLLIVAKNDEAHINVSNQIKEHLVKKTYVALVRGVIKENEATINIPIARSMNDRVKMSVSKRGKEAITHFKVLKRYDGFTYVEVNIETGRTHQIRVHMSHIGYPIVGDAVYSNGRNPFGVEGQMLHSAKLEFVHPKTKQKMELEAKLPKYFEDVLKKLDGEI